MGTLKNKYALMNIGKLVKENKQERKMKANMNFLFLARFLHNVLAISGLKGNKMMKKRDGGG